jgi:transcriptional regulator with XRE-family HTH domain
MLRASRHALGLSQHRVSDLTAEYGIPVSRSAICDIERGFNMPGVESLVSLCNVLQLDPREILERVISPMELVGDVARSSIAELKHRVSLLYWNCQYRAMATVCAALLVRIESERSSEPTERQKLCFRIEISRAAALRRGGRFQAAEAAARRSLYFASGSADFQAESLLALARLHTDQAVFPLAQAESDQAVRLAEVGGSPRVLAFAWAAKAGYLYCTVRLEEAAEACRRARDYSIQARDERIQAGAEGTLGSCLLDLGHPSAALKRYVSAVELARKGGDRNGEACWQLETGRVALCLEALDEADRRAAAGLSIARSGDSPFLLFRGIWLQHQIARRRNSLKPDRQRVAYLKRLYPRVAGDKSMDVIREFKREILGLEDA